MKLKGFIVENYKVFKGKMEIEFSDGCMAILTGRNNTGKSTILEAINRFYMKETKTKTILNDCYNDTNEEIRLTAIFKMGEVDVEITKVYKDELAPRFYDVSGNEINAKHSLKGALDEILSDPPFYITPSMTPEDVNNLIQDIYSEIIKNDLAKLESLEFKDDEKEQLEELLKEYTKLKKAYPEFLRKLKTKTDKLLEEISTNVSLDLRGLFSNDQLNLIVKGGESQGFSQADILRTTNSQVNIDSNHQTEMSLENQGTGLQRMSLVFLIQNMMQNRLLGINNNKLLLIDEPEAFLHPEAVRALSRSLYKIGKEMPLIISTHSPILIDLSESHTSIQVFRVGETEAIQLYKSSSDQFDEDDIENMKILNYVDSYVNEFFFADKILIVEGDTEYIAFKHLAKLMNENIHIIRARGKSTIGTIMKILNQFNTNYNVIHDVDNHERYSSSTLKAQRTNCMKLYDLKGESVNIYCSVANFENALGIGDVNNDEKTQTIYRILNDDIPDGTEYGTAKQLIEKLFNKIVLGIDDEYVGSNFYRIAEKSEYENFFEELIKRKKEKEDLQKENVSS